MKITSLNCFAVVVGLFAAPVTFADEFRGCFTVLQEGVFGAVTCFERRGEVPPNGAGLYVGFMQMGDRGPLLIPGYCRSSVQSGIQVRDGKPVFVFGMNGARYEYVIEKTAESGERSGTTYIFEGDRRPEVLKFTEMSAVDNALWMAPFALYTDEDLTLTCSSTSKKLN